MAKSKEMELAIKIAGKIDKSFNSAIANANKSLRGMTKTLAVGSVAAAAAVGAITLKAVGVGKEFESSMSQVAATLQLDSATEEGAAQLAILEEAARQCGRETAFSASEAAEGLNMLAMAGYGASDAATALPSVLALAGAGAIEMGDSARYITATLASLGLEKTEENFNHLADVMASTAAKAKTDVGQMGEALTTLGGTGQGLKGGVNEIAASLGVLANADITGAEGGTHLRNLILSLQNPRNAKAAELFKSLGVNAYDSMGQMRGLNEIFGDLNTAMAGMTDQEKNSIMSQIFKQTDLAAARAMLQGCGEEYDNLYEAASKSSEGIGAAQQMYNTQMDNLEGDIAILKSALSDVGISVYKNLQPALRGAVQFGTEIVSAFGDAFAKGDLEGAINNVIELIMGKLGQLPEGVKQAAAAIAGIGLANAVSAFLDSKLWQGGVKGVKGFTEAAGQFPKAFPTLLGRARNALVGFVPSGLRSRISGIFGTIGGRVAGMSSQIGQAASTAWNNFTNDNVLGKVLGKITGFAGRAGSALGKVAGTVLDVGGKLAGGLQAMMGMALKMFMPAALIGALLVGLGLIQSRFGEQIDGILAQAREKGPQIIMGLANGIASRIPALLSQGARLVANLLSTIGALAPSLIMGGAQILIALVNGVAQNAPMLISSAVQCIGGFATGILQALPLILVSGMQLLLGLAQGIAQNLPVMAQGAIQAILGFAQGFISALPMILSIAGQIIVSLIQGIVTALPALASGAVQIIGTLAQGFITNLPMIIQTGVQVIAAIGMGLISGIGTLLGMVPQLFAMLGDMIMNTDWVKVGSDIVKSIGDGIKGGAKGIWDAVKGAVTGGGDKGDEKSSGSTPEAPTMPSTSSYTSAGVQGAAAYAAGFQSGAPQIGAATQAAVNGTTSGIGLSVWQQAGTNGATAFTTGIDANLAGYQFDTSNLGIDGPAFATMMGTAGDAGGTAFTTGLDSSLLGYSFDTSGINLAGVGEPFQAAGGEGGAAFTTGLESSFAGYTFDPSSIGLNATGFIAELQTAASDGGSAFTSSLDGSMSSYSIDTSSIGIDSSSLTAAMTEAGTAGGEAFTTALSASLGASSFDLMSAANIDTSSVNTAMTTAGNSGGSAFTGALSSSISSYQFNPSSVGANAGSMASYMRPVGTAGGNALTQGLTSAINAGRGSVVGAARSLANGVASAISSGFSKAKSSASSAMHSIKSTCSSQAKAAASAVKSAFENMTIKIPKPKVPHITVGSASKTVGTQTVSYPTFSVSYHALGGIFDRATLLQSLTGGAHVVGEAGPEAILPLDTLWDKMRSILLEILQGRTGTVDTLLSRIQNMSRNGQQSPEPAGAGAGGGAIYFNPTYNLYGSATREDAEAAGRASFEEFKKFMERYERDNRRKKF